MTIAARAILARFAEVYPTSAHARGGRKLRLGRWERHDPRIGDDIDHREEFLAAVDELIATGIVSAKWRRFREGSELEALYLEDPVRLYAELNLPSPEAIRQAIVDELSSPRWTAPCSSAVEPLRNALRDLYLDRTPAGIADRDDPIQLLADLAVLLKQDPQTTSRVPIRALSVRLYNDSKRLERLVTTVDPHAENAGGVSLSATFGLARSFPEVTLALRGMLRFSGARVSREWRCTGEPVTLPHTLRARLSAIVFDEPAPIRVLSVENKETFHVLARRLMEGDAAWFGGLVYTAGHPNAEVVAVLSLCADAGATLHHFGDLDPDGILIAAEIAGAVGREVTAAWMDKRVYETYLSFGYRVAPASMSRLRNARVTIPVALRPLAETILASGIGVEQEVIDTDRTEAGAGGAIADTMR